MYVLTCKEIKITRRTTQARGYKFELFQCIFPTAPTMSAVGKEPHLRVFFLFFRGPLLDWFGQIMLYSHWSTQTWRSTNACDPATDEAVVCALIEPSNAGAY